MLSVGPQGAATLGNKGAHCLLHVQSPAVFCYRKHFKKYDTADHYLTSLANIHAVVVRIFIILSQHVTSLQGAFVAVITGRSSRTQDGSKR